MLPGVRLQIKPVAGDIEEVRATVPVKLFTDATVTVDGPATPALTVRLVGAPERVKSCTV
jgi:hypothetical protein